MQEQLPGHLNPRKHVPFQLTHPIRFGFPCLSPCSRCPFVLRSEDHFPERRGLRALWVGRGARAEFRPALGPLRFWVALSPHRVKFQTGRRQAERHCSLRQGAVTL